MTEYELIDAINGTSELLATSFSMYVTFTTAYLICAYLVGGSLVHSPHPPESAAHAFADKPGPLG